MVLNEVGQQVIAVVLEAGSGLRSSISGICENSVSELPSWKPSPSAPV
ncbi:hypothetical protein [Trueperella sp.]